MKNPYSAVPTTGDSAGTHVTRNTPGLAPNALALAYADWALHMMASPERQWELLLKAVSLSNQTGARLFTDTVGGDGPSVTQDHRFDGPDWNSWPFNFFKESFQATEAW